MDMTTTKNIDTFPRNCEMGNGALRLGYSFPARAHDAAFLEQSFRDGGITAAELTRGMREIEGRRYSA
jgi:hypothetical protein